MTWAWADDEYVNYHAGRNGLLWSSGVYPQRGGYSRGENCADDSLDELPTSNLVDLTSCAGNSRFLGRVLRSAKQGRHHMYNRGKRCTS
jgi:hypothetical protein